MSGNEIRKKYLDFFAARGHEVIPSASLVPENDPTTLFTGSGMQPLVPYLMGKEHPKGTRLTDSQKCFRAEDIEEVGDNRHTTFFEMLGNWSLGDYFKKEQLRWFFEFLTDEKEGVGLNPKNLYVTAFIGDEASSVPKDTESVEIWKELFSEKEIDASVVEIGSEKDGYKKGMQNGRIFYYDAAKNWWSRAGKPENMPEGEIGGPDSEVFYDFGTEHDPEFGEHCHPNCDCGRFLEIGNSVFMEYLKTEKGFEKLPKQNVDFGGGLERITAAVNNDSDVFKVDLLSGIIQQLEIWTGKKYEDIQCQTSFRIIADHLRAAVFMISDGVLPSSSEQGYFVRRLLRRAVLYADKLGLNQNDLYKIVLTLSEVYKKSYPEIEEKRSELAKILQKEEAQFRKTLKRGAKTLEVFVKDNVELGDSVSVVAADELKKHIPTLKTYENGDNFPIHKPINGKVLFDVYTTHGFPAELSISEFNNLRKRYGLKELSKEQEERLLKEFRVLFKQHQETSRAGAEQKFKGGLADHGEKTVQYHTATHLLLAGLRKELGDHVHQAGSNITSERLRFDFTHPEKVERDVLDRVEKYVNDAIKAGATVSIETMDKEDAENDSTIEGSFWDRYPDKVNIYTVKGSDGIVYSRELCGGPHVENTGTISGTFKITKEESSAAGVRRIKAVLG